MTAPIRIFLGGDVMTGRGIDQVMPLPVDPVLHEPWVQDARTYVRLAEAANGPIPRPIGPEYVWGDALAELRRTDVDVRIINLETSITLSEAHWTGKVIHYRMHPGNVECLTAAAIDCCCLANNHVLDWGREGLAETLRTLDAAGLRYAGAGPDAPQAAVPAVLPAPGKGRVLVFSAGTPCSGIPREWCAREARSGVRLLPDLSESTARQLGSEIRRVKHPGDVAVLSVHWGGNWGYEVPAEQVEFAHRLIEEGVDLVHGHSSHHVKPLEIYRERLILYGCGDFINDYEGIRGYEQYRSDLRLMFLLRLDPETGQFLQARLVPLQARRFRLHRATEADAQWLCDLLNGLGSPISLEGDYCLLLHR